MARTLVNAPSVLFLDEPTNGLDPVSAQAIRRLIKQEADRGAAVLLTTHDMLEADELSDRVAFINEGKLYAIDTPENLKLAHGKRSLKVRLRHGADVEERTVLLDDASAGDEVKAAIGSGGLMTIHTEEASLENIFIQMTGRGLEG
jgi:ABC-2 type transport system ATP-binding protein